MNQEALDHCLSESMDIYLEMPPEQAAMFDAWLKEELDAGRLSEKPGEETLHLVTRAWSNGWASSRSGLVNEVHDR